MNFGVVAEMTPWTSSTGAGSGDVRWLGHWLTWDQTAWRDAWGPGPQWWCSYSSLCLGGKRGFLFPERELGEGGGRALPSRCQAEFEEQRDKSREVGGLNPSPHFLLLSLSRCSCGSCLSLPIVFPEDGKGRKRG